MHTLKEINEKVNKASWETTACELEQLAQDILNKMDDKRVSKANYALLSCWYDKIHHLTFKESQNPDFIIKNVFDEKVGQIEKLKKMKTGELVALYLYHELDGFMLMNRALRKLLDLKLFIEEVKNDNL